MPLIQWMLISASRDAQVCIGSYCKNPQATMKLEVVSSLLLLSLSLPFAAAAEESYINFLATSERTNVSNTDQHYVVRIVDPDTIWTARAELEKLNGYQIVAGTINTTAVEWNPGWSFHVVPGSVNFGDFFTEVCDANVEFVEKNLQNPDFGGAFLPDYFWCPWGSRILAELQPETENRRRRGPTLDKGILLRPPSRQRH